MIAYLVQRISLPPRSDDLFVRLLPFFE